MIEDRGRDYINARRVSKEYEAVTRGLNRNLPSVPPLNTPEEATQVGVHSFTCKRDTVSIALDRWVTRETFFLVLFKNTCYGYSLEVPHTSF